MRNLPSRNFGRIILLDIEHELRATDQVRHKNDGIDLDARRDKAG